MLGETLKQKECIQLTKVTLAKYELNKALPLLCGVRGDGKH